PEPPPAAGAYAAVQISGDLLAVSGQFPLSNGQAAYAGRIGADLTIEQGRAAAQLAALNVLAQIDAALGGLDRLAGLARMDGYLLPAPDFMEHARVLDGASELFNAVLADRGRHARAVFGVATLPRNMPIELVVLAKMGKA